MAETERTLHDELVSDVGEAMEDWACRMHGILASSHRPGKDNGGQEALALVAVFERHFRARLLSDDVVRAYMVERWGGDYWLAWQYEYARRALRAALDHVCGPETRNARAEADASSARVQPNESTFWPRHSLDMPDD
jgi:hypothetical protein